MTLLPSLGTACLEEHVLSLTKALAHFWSGEKGFSSADLSQPCESSKEPADGGSSTWLQIKQCCKFSLSSISWFHRPVHLDLVWGRPHRRSKAAQRARAEHPWTGQCGGSWWEHLSPCANGLRLSRQNLPLEGILTRIWLQYPPGMAKDSPRSGWAPAPGLRGAKTLGLAVSTLTQGLKTCTENQPGKQWLAAECSPKLSTGQREGEVTPPVRHPQEGRGTAALPSKTSAALRVSRIK